MVSSRGQAFTGRAAVWAANLSRIDWVRLDWTVKPTTAPVSDARRATLGDDAWVQQVRVEWSLAGETQPAEDELWLTFVDEESGDLGSVTRIAGDSDKLTPAEPTPIWLQQPVQLHRSGSVLLLSDSGDASHWLAQSDAAQRAVRQRIEAVDLRSVGTLVVEVPQSRRVFERSLGVEPGSYAAVAAAAWPMARQTNSAPIHVLVNPEASERLSALGRAVLLTHETVHVVTRSPGSAAPTWLTEGYADQIAYAAHPAGRTPAERSVRKAVRRHGVPDDWPAESDFAPDAENLDLGYDLAWSAVDSIAKAYGIPAVDRFYAAVDAGSSIEEAAQAIGTTERSLRKRWQRQLHTLASR